MNESHAFAPAGSGLVAVPRAAVFAVLEREGHAMLGTLRGGVCGGLAAVVLQPLTGLLDLRLDAGEVRPA